MLLNYEAQTERTIRNSNPDIVISDHENMSIYIKRYCKYGRQKYDQERSQDDSKI